MKNPLSQQNYLVYILVWIQWHVNLHSLIYILKYFYRLEELIQESQQRAIEQADVDSLGTSLGELDDSSRMSMPSSETPTMPKGDFWIFLFKSLVLPSILVGGTKEKKYWSVDIALWEGKFEK